MKRCRLSDGYGHNDAQARIGKIAIGPKGDIDAALGSLRKCAAPLLIGLPSTRKEELAPVRSIGLMALKTLLTCPQPSI